MPRWPTRSIAAHQDMHTRFPVTERAGDPQQIVGYVNFKDIVAALRLSPKHPSLRAVVRRLLSLNSETSVATCLEQLIREYTHIALVREPSGTVVGMITMEDVIEELVGEIGDEYDRLPSHVIPVGTGWIVGGNATLDHLRNVAGIEFPVDEGSATSTLNQWVIQRLGRPPRGGDQLPLDSTSILVRKVRRQAVQEAQLIRDVPMEADNGHRSS